MLLNIKSDNNEKTSSERVHFPASVHRAAESAAMEAAKDRAADRRVIPARTGVMLTDSCVIMPATDVYVLLYSSICCHSKVGLWTQKMINYTFIFILLIESAASVVICFQNDLAK